MAKKPSKQPVAKKAGEKRTARPANGEGATENRSEKLFPVVGIGASAGGLEAFTAVLRHLPKDTGMAFVLVQHLDPKHESLLAELLSRASSIPIQEVREGMLVEPDHAYVIPPNTDMGISGGSLKLRPPTPVRGQRMPIDHFFRSLAAELGSRAIGVILSGSSSDGALGLEAIKAEGGITFAQDEKTAKYDGMPRAAAATGCVDFVLPPEGIADELARIGRHPYVKQVELEPAESEAESEAERREEREAQRKMDPLSRIFALLRGATGVDFSLYKHSTIRRRIARRMALHKVEKLEDYLALIERNPGEIDALYQEILIKVTGFFRDPEAFDALKAKVFPEIVARLSPDTPIRVWVPGCSTGEEAYSVAIVLLEFLSERNIRNGVQIFATDVSEQAIEKARAATYIENIGADVSPERLRRFFVRHDGGYQVTKMVRDLCVFARQNLTKDPPFSRLDLVSCRNVLIYLEPTLQRRVVPLFHYSLKPDGFLLLGGSETIGTFPDLFTLVDKKHKIYLKRHATGQPHFDYEAGLRARAEGGRPAAHVEEQAVAGADLQKEADRIVLSRFAPAGVIINEDFEVVQFRGKTSPYLEPAPGRATLNLLKMLREGLLLEVRSAVQQAKRTGKPVEKRNVSAKHNHGFRLVDIEVSPLPSVAQGRHYLVLFAEVPSESEAPKDKGKGRQENRQLAQLKQELVATREYLQSIIEEQEATNEELQSANEEVLSSNEELQSINEELETAKEELQSTNEELTTVNEELQNRNSELTQTNDDLNNLLSNVNIAIVMLGSDLRIRRFTPMAGRILNLIPTDLGRPITDLRPSVQVPDLEKTIVEVIDTVSVREREVEDHEGRWYSMTVRPYRTLDNRIEGAVLTLVDIDVLKRSAGEAGDLRGLIGTIIETIADPVILLDSESQVKLANPALFEFLRSGREAVQGKRLDQLASLRALVPEIERQRKSLLDSLRAEVDLDGRRMAARIQTIRGAGGAQEFLVSLHSPPDEAGVLRLDAETGEITGVNSRLAAWLDSDALQLVGRKLWEVPELRGIAGSEQAFHERRSQFGPDGQPVEIRDGERMTVTGATWEADGRPVIELALRK